MIDDRFLGEWISERTGDRLDFYGSNITVVGIVYTIGGRSGLPFDSRKWCVSETADFPPLSCLHFINERKEVLRFIYEFKKENTEVELFEEATKEICDVLHRM